MEKLVIRFYNGDIWISYTHERQKHEIQLRVPYPEAKVYFVPNTPHDLSEQYIGDPLRILRLGYLQEQIQKEGK